MSDTTAGAQGQLPGTDDIKKVVALLREDMTEAVRSEAADRLVMLAAQESHALAKAALLERAGKLVSESDPQRAVMLLRESFRLFPKRTVGELLRDHGKDESSLHRLSRMSLLFDSIAALQEQPDSHLDALFDAASFHVEQGHGQRALATIRQIEQLASAAERSDELSNLQQAATAASDARNAKLAVQRQAIDDADELERGQLLHDYAELLLAGDEPLADASAVLADAIAAGLYPETTAPLWAEVARAVGEPEMLARALGACLEHADKVHEKLRFADELANLQDIESHSPGLLMTALQTLAEAMPDDMGIKTRWLVARVHEGDAEAGPALESLRLTAVKERDRQAEAAICLALSRIAKENGDEAKVEKHLRRVRTLDPRNIEALSFFEQQYRSSNDQQRLYLVLTQRLAVSSGGDVVRIATEMAEIAETALDHAERAIEAYHRVLSVDGENQLALLKLEALYRKTEAWGPVRELLDRRARSQEARAGSDEEARAAATALLEQLVTMHRDDGELPDAAALFETLRRLHDANPKHADAASELAAHYRRDGRWRHLAAVLETQLEHEADASKRGSVARELHKVLQEKLGDHDRAMRALTSVADSGDASADTLRTLADAFRESGDDAGHLHALQRLRPLLEGDALTNNLEEASALSEASGDRVGAVSLYEALRNHKPDHLGAKRGLTRLYGSVGKHAELVALIDEQLATSELDTEERAELYERLALTCAEHLADMERAEEAAKHLQTLRPSSEIGGEIAARALFGRGDHSELRALHAADQAGAKAYVDRVRAYVRDRADARAIDALLAAAATTADELGDASAAADLAAQALSIATEGDAENVSDVARVVSLHAEAAGRNDLEVLAIATLVERAEGEQRLVYLAQRVALFEVAEDWEGAHAAVTALVSERIGVGDLADIGGAADRVTDLAERVGQEEDVPLMLCAWASVLTDSREQAAEGRDEVATALVELLSRAQDQALMLGVELDDVRTEVERGLQACGEDPQLLQLLEQVCAELGDWATVVSSLQRRAAQVDGDARAELLLQAATRCDSALGEAEAAAALYEEVTTLQPANAEAWSGLLDALRTVADEQKLGAASARYLLAPIEDRPGKSAIAVQRVGQLVDADATAETINEVLVTMLSSIARHDDLLDAEEGIIDIAAGRLALESGAAALAAALLPAAQRHGRSEQAQQCFALLGATLEPGSSQRRELLQQWASAASGASDREAAVAAWTMLLEDQPGSIEALDALELLHREAEDFDAVALTLEDRIAAETNTDEREAGWLRLADVHLSDRNASEDALEVLTRAVADLPTSEALSAMQLEALRERGADAALVAALDARAASEADVDLKRALMTEAALAQQALGAAPAETMQRWLALLDDDVTNETAAGAAAALATESSADIDFAALEALATVLETREDNVALDAVLSVAARRCDPSQQVRVLKRQMALREGVLEDRKGAFLVAAAALQLAPEDDALHAAAERLAGEGDEAAALALKAARAGAESDPAKRAAAFLAHAQQAVALGLEEAAVDSWQRVLDGGDDAMRLEAAAALAEVHDRAGDHLKHADILLVQRELTDDEDARVSLSIMAAEQFADAGQHERAMSALRDAEKSAPSHIAVWTALDATLRRSGDLSALAAHLQHGWQTVLTEAGEEARGAALDEQLATLRSLDANSEQLWPVCRAALDAQLASAALSDALISAARQAAEVKDAPQRELLRLAGAEQALTTEQFQVAVDICDAALADTPENAPAWAMRGAALSELAASEERDALLAAHYQHGIDHAAEDDVRQSAALLLAEHRAAALDDAQGAFELIVETIAAAAVDEREDLYQLAQRYAEQADLQEPLWNLLESEANESQDAGDKWLALAEQVANHLESLPRAAQYAKRGLDSGGDKLAAIAILDRVADGPQQLEDALVELLIAHHTAGDVARAATLLTAQADSATSKKKRIAALTSLVELTDSEAGRAAELDPLAPLLSLAMVEPNRSKRWQAAREIAQPERLEDILHTVMSAYEAVDEADEKLRHDLLLVASETAEQAGDGEAAMGYARMALGEQERDSTRQRLRDMLGALGDHEALAHELEQQAELVPEKKVALLEQALTQWLDHVGDAERGMHVLDQLLAADPDRSDLADRRLDVMRLTAHEGYSAALAEAVAAARQQDQTQRLARLLPKHIAAAGSELSPAQRFELLSELAAVSESPVALAEFVEEMAADADALDPPDAKTVFAWLLHNVDQHDQPERYVAARLQQLGTIDDPTEQLPILDDLVGHARGPLADEDAAVEWASRAMLLDVGNDDRVVALLDMASTPEQVETALPALQAALEVREGDARPSAATMLRILRMAPSDEATFELLIGRCDEERFCAEIADEAVALLREAGAHTAAAQLSRRHIAHLDPSARGDAVTALAETMASELGEQSAALTMMIESAPALESPGELLERALDLARQSDAVADWLTTVEQALNEGSFKPPAETTVVALAAAVAADDRGDAARAAELWTRLWDLNPGDADARDAVLAMRRDANDAEQLSADLERAIIQGGDGADDLSVELAELYHNELGRSREALSNIRTVLRRQPDNQRCLELTEALSEVSSCRDQALALLDSAYRANGSWRQLAATLARRAEDGPVRERAKVLEALAALQLSQLQEPTEALNSLTHALELKPSAPLLQQAVTLGREHGSPETPARLFDLALNATLSREDRVEVLAAAAEYYHHEREDTVRAEALWTELLELTSTHVGAFEALDSIYESADRWDDLITLLERRAARTRGVVEQQSILHRLAGIAQSIQRNDVAIDAYEQLAKLNPEDTDPLAMIVELLRNGANPRKLAETLEALAALAANVVEQARSLSEAAHIHATRLDDETKAERLYERAFELCPGDDEAYRWLERKIGDDKQRLLALYEHRSRGVEAGPSRTRVLRKRARALIEQGRAGEAKDVLKRAHSEDPDNEALEDDLLSACLASDDYAGYEAVATRRLKDTLARPQRVDLLANLTRLAIKHDRDTSKWLDQLREHDTDGAHIKALESLVRADSGDPEVAAAGLEQILAQASDDDERADVLQKLAELYEGPLDNSARAITSYRKILAMQPHRADVQQKLADLFRSRGSMEALAETLRKWLATLGDDPKRVPVMAQLGAALHQLGKDAEARQVLEDAYLLDRNSLQVNELLATLLRRENKLERAVELQQWVVEFLRRQRRKELIPAAATAAGEMLTAIGQPTQAQRQFRTALHAERGHVDATLGLGRAYVAQNNATRGMAEFEKVARLAASKATQTQRCVAHVELAKCWLAQGKKANARAALNKALALVPDDAIALQLLTEI